MGSPLAFRHIITAFVTLLMGLAINFCLAQEGLIVQGFARCDQPNMKVEGRATNGMVTTYHFTTQTLGYAARLEVITVQDTGATGHAIIFSTNNECLYYRPNDKGENAAGPAKGKYVASAHIWNSALPSRANLTPTLILPFWRARYPLDNGTPVWLPYELTWSSAPSRDGQTQFIITNRGNVPAQGTQLYLCESPGLTRNIWQFDTATNVGGQFYPLSYRRTIVFGKLLPVGEKSPVIVPKQIMRYWQITVTNIASTTNAPAWPEMNGPTYVTDSRYLYMGASGIDLDYLTDRWKTFDEVANDPVIMSQLSGPPKAAMPAVPAAAASPTREGPNYTFMAIGVGAFLGLLGLVYLLDRSRNKSNAN